MSVLRRSAIALLPAALLLVCGSVSAFSQSESTLATMSAGTTGAYPVLILQASDGNFYVATEYGPGRSPSGSFLQITPAGSVKVLYNLNGTTDGSYPAALVEGSDGNLYGANAGGGNANCSCGTLFRLTMDGTYTVLHTFTGNYVSGVMDAGGPRALTLANDGNFYTVTSEGGPQNLGALVQLAVPSGAYKIVAQFPSSGPNPESGLVQASDGLFYGIIAQSDTFFNAPQGFYSMTLSGTETVLTSTLPQTIDYSDSPLVEGQDGKLYGASYTGGPSETNPVCEYGCGQVYDITTSGAYTPIFSFGAGQDGEGPTGNLLLGSDGNYYGVTIEGGDFSVSGGTGAGTIYQVTPGGTGRALYLFQDASDGQDPVSITQGADGNFYGTVASGGDQNNDGTVFKLAGLQLKPPVELLAPATATINSPFTLTFNVYNAFSDTMQQCYAFVQNAAAGAGSWTGRQTGKLTSNVYTGSVTLTPTTAGTYTYAMVCGGIESGFVTVKVNGAKVNTTSALTVSPNPIYTTQNVTVTATVKKSSDSGVPTGNVVFSASGVTLATVALNGSGVASFTAPTSAYPPNTYSVTAAYQGDSMDNVSTSAPVNVTLKAPAKTTTTLTSSASTVTPPASVTLTADVTSTTGTPTGNVTFYVNGISLGTVATNSSGVAKLSGSTSGQPAGNYTVTAKYLGDTDYATSTSNGVPVTVR